MYDKFHVEVTKINKYLPIMRWYINKAYIFPKSLYSQGSLPLDLAKKVYSNITLLFIQNYLSLLSHEL